MRITDLQLGPNTKRALHTLCYTLTSLFLWTLVRWIPSEYHFLFGVGLGLIVVLAILKLRRMTVRVGQHPVA
jgi:hypothetical protein